MLIANHFCCFPCGLFGRPIVTGNPPQFCRDFSQKKSKGQPSSSSTTHLLATLAERAVFCIAANGLCEADANCNADAPCEIWPVRSPFGSPVMGRYPGPGLTPLQQVFDALATHLKNLNLGHVIFLLCMSPTVRPMGQSPADPSLLVPQFSRIARRAQDLANCRSYS